MYESIQKKLVQSLILDENEPVLSFIQVVDFVKQQQQFKKIVKEELANLLTNVKHYYLLASSKVNFINSVLHTKNKIYSYFLKLNLPITTPHR
jgi:hypothetical protein